MVRYYTFHPLTCQKMNNGSIFLNSQWIISRKGYILFYLPQKLISSKRLENLLQNTLTRLTLFACFLLTKEKAPRIDLSLWSKISARRVIIYVSILELSYTSFCDSHFRWTASPIFKVVHLKCQSLKSHKITLKLKRK